jgi:mRNA (guanine-N7-)-methyltransferase
VLTERLAAEYGLQLVYKKAFNEILSEEQSSRDFGPLLAKMGVLNSEGASNMDEAQWEAASKSLFVLVSMS